MTFGQAEVVLLAEHVFGAGRVDQLRQADLGQADVWQADVRQAQAFAQTTATTTIGDNALCTWSSNALSTGQTITVQNNRM